jgi:hypothetical protein
MLVRQTAADGHRQSPLRDDSANGWLVVQNLVAVLALLLLPTLAGLEGTAAIYDPFVSLVERLLGTPVAMGGVLALALLKLAAFIGFMLVAGHSVIPWLLHAIARQGSRELFRLAIIAIALVLALGAAWLFGVSLALGAFLAGMILNARASLGRAARQTLPLRDAFAVLFFVAVGMLFDPGLFLTQPLPLLATLLIVMLGKSLAAFAAMLLFRRSVADALGLSARLAQIGEFSFILVSAGVALALLPPEALGLVLAGMLISILFNPLLFWGAARLQPRIEARMGAAPDQRVEPVDSALPPEPRLPPTDNLLEQAVILPAAAVAVEAMPAEPAILPEPVAETAPPPAAEPEIPEAAPAETVIILPSPEAAEEDLADAAPARDESPAPLDEAAPPLAETGASGPDDAPETFGSAEAETPTEPEIFGPPEKADAVIEPEAPETEDTGAPAEEKPDAPPPPIPAVVPEPKS